MRPPSRQEIVTALDTVMTPLEYAFRGQGVEAGSSSLWSALSVIDQCACDSYTGPISARSRTERLDRSGKGAWGTKKEAKLANKLVERMQVDPTRCALSPRYAAKLVDLFAWS